eukprot:scaffold3187_cov361-Prasinococcus_capsulatus_cf.AAC.10
MAADATGSCHRQRECCIPPCLCHPRTLLAGSEAGGVQGKSGTATPNTLAVPSRDCKNQQRDACILICVAIR